MKKLIIIIIIGVAAYGAYYFYTNKLDKLGELRDGIPQEVSINLEAAKEIPSLKYVSAYENDDYGFGFKYPDGFNVMEMPIESGQVLILQNQKTDVGLQIMITQYDGTEESLTAESVKQSVPDLTIKEPQELFIGESGAKGKGLAFVSDNAEFGGKSREVWFIYNGNLYQMSTYLDYDELIKGILNNWEFK